MNSLSLTGYTATYSPDDNKLRLYASSRLDSETYARVKAAGFRWAARQELFVAPMWTPEREDLLLELAGEVGDEDTSLVDRAEGRAERFEGYSERRAADAEGARRAVAAIADNIPFGQPILVGHHSERHARRDAAKIENGMRKAVKMWETSEYWTRRAAGSIRHAKYKELPAVRARRIKTIEADKRGRERDLERAEKARAAWMAEGLDMRRALMLSGDGYHGISICRCYPLAEFPRQPPASQYEGEMSLWSALDAGIIDAEQARDLVIPACGRVIARAERWIAHYENRLAYERAMLAESGYTPPPKPKTKADLPLLNYPGLVAYRNPYRQREITRSEAVGVTKAELAAIHPDYKGTRVSECGTHRIRVAMLRRGPVADRFETSVVYLTDSKQHVRPAIAAVNAQAQIEERATMAEIDTRLKQSIDQAAARAVHADARAKSARTAAPFLALANSLTTGVQVVTAPQLFPTPGRLAERMAVEADIPPGADVLEPEAGSGMLLRAIHGTTRGDVKITAVELNAKLAEYLRTSNPSNHVVTGDFLELAAADIGSFDRIVMNPPFAQGQDVPHIKHALTFLRSGGRLVAICADGPRQNAELKPVVEEMGGTWEQLPPDTFEEAGTSVRVVLIALTRDAA